MKTQHRLIAIILFAFTISFTSVCLSQSKADDCSLTFKGSVRARKAVKLRKASDGSAYDKIENGQPISVAKWLDLACELNDQIPEDLKIPASKAIDGVETKKVTISGYLLAAKFEGSKTGDRDIHAEISDSKLWRSKHMIIEIPPGNEYCTARKNLWTIVTDDPAKMKSSGKILKKPVKVTVTGYVFLDAAHGADCEDDGGRGMLKNGKGDKSQVVGLYEIHPVLELSRN